MRRTLLFVIAIISLCWCSPAVASVITFDDLSVGPLVGPVWDQNISYAQGYVMEDPVGTGRILRNCCAPHNEIIVEFDVSVMSVSFDFLHLAGVPTVNVEAWDANGNVVSLGQSSFIGVDTGVDLLGQDVYGGHAILSFVGLIDKLVFSDSGMDMAIDNLTTEMPVPEPASILLFGTGTVVVAHRIFRRQRRKLG